MTSESAGRLRIAVAALLLLLAASVTLNGMITVAQTEYATGWDGYYYLVQVKSLVEKGEMHSPEYSPVYVPLLAFHAVTGNYEAAYRMSSVLIKLLFVVSVFVMSLSLLCDAGEKEPAVRRFTALMAASISALSPSLNYFFTQFPKNLLGFALLLFFMASVMGLARRFREEGTISVSGFVVLRLLGVFLLFAATFFTHRFSAVLSVLFLLLYALPWAGGRLRSIMHRTETKYWIVGAAALILLASLLLISENLPLAPSLDDLERVTQDLSPVPMFAPAAFTRTFGLFRISLPWLVEIYSAALLPLATCLLLLFRRKLSFLRRGKAYYILLLFSLPGLFPFLSFTLTGLSYRLFFGTLLLLPLVLIPFIGKAIRMIFRVCSSCNESRAVPVLSGAVLLTVFISFFTAGTYRPQIHDPPYGFYQELSDQVLQVLSEKDWELIIAHKALAEMITYRHGADALPWAPEEHFSRDGVWRITAGVLRDEVAYYIGPENADEHFIRLSGDYGLLREDRWEEFMEAISGEPVMLEALDTWRNPMEQRPEYLGKGEQ